METPRVINLYSLEQPAIIVKAETGLIYSNQVNGVACSHPRQEGFLVLLSPANKSDIFSPDRWYKQMPELNDALYDEIESVLNGKYSFHWHVRDIRVDRAAKNYEAWIHVRFRGDFEVRGIFSGGFTTDPNKKPEPENYPIYEGILTWENCD